ncbi:MAG: isoleucine--tRNA ligase [Chloroflexota bacterium]
MSTANGIAEVSTRTDFTQLERDLIAWWNEAGIIDAYLRRNDGASDTFSFIDGPITANNPMGVHHAWGRSYKDLFQRYHNMLGKRQRFQNGFDCQGLWVEVEVEKELGLKSKRDIESFGVAEFVERCKARVEKFAGRITDQSKRLAYWMHWDDSYFTMSDENNYTIWQFLKTCWEKGWVYKGHDVMPWCPRCGTGISEHEIVTEGYQDRTHLSIYVKFPLLDEPGANLLAWTTTPWTLAANVAAAVHPELVYLKVLQGGETLYVAREAARTAIRGEHEIVGEVTGAELVGRPYAGPFDDLPAARGIAHTVISWTEVDAAEGTGIVHIAPGCGKEDFALSKEGDGLPVIAPINEFGVYVEGFGDLTDRYVHEVANSVAERLAAAGRLYRAENYKHRYPVCWRCGTDLVFRLVDEWFISMADLRPVMMEITRNVAWRPAFGMDRELDWLEHMDDWMISKKRYWGLALPIFECHRCGRFEVIGGEQELEARAVSGWSEFAGHSPHRPWIDAVRIACSSCGEHISRIADVGNPWLDAGIVPFSTIGFRNDRQYWDTWYPADLISESFPGQFRNWFYSMIAQAAAITGTPPFRNVFSYALMRDQKGEEMHKSKGNAIWFDDAAEEYGVDTMRWLFATCNPDVNLNFGPTITDEVRRRFILPLWNSYAFFANYARLDGFDPAASVPLADRTLLDRWIVSRLHQLIAEVRAALDDYQPHTASRAIERFTVDELSNWYIRRNRRRFWKTENDGDKAAAYATLHECLVTISGLLAPFTPFIADAIYRNLVAALDPAAPPSVHLTDFPLSDPARIDPALSADMSAVLAAVSLGHAARQAGQVKVRQPLPAMLVHTRTPQQMDALFRLQDQVLDELNIKALLPLTDPGEVVAYDIRPNLPLLGPRYGKQLGAVRHALAAAPAAEVARAVAAGESVSLALPDGSSVSLLPEEILVDMLRQEGFAAAQHDGMTVVLDTALTPDLLREGLARDFVRAIQDARKSAGFRIEDRIEVGFVADPEVAEAVAAHRDSVMAETLAVDLEVREQSGWSDALEPASVAGPGGGIADGVYIDQVPVGQHQVRIALRLAR